MATPRSDPRLPASVRGRRGAPATPRGILAVQTQRIGDVMCFTPLLQALREAYPRTRILALVQPPAPALLAGNPHVDQVIVYDPTRERGLRGVLPLARRLARLEIDWALSIHAAGTVAAAMALARIPWRSCVWRYGATRTPPWRRAFHQAIVQQRDRGEQHEIDYNLDVLRALGVPCPEYLGTYTLVPSDADRVAAEGALRAAGIPDGAPFAVVHPGHGGGRQQWAPARFGEVARGLFERHGLPVVVTGAPAECDLAEQVVAASGGTARSLAGALSLMGLAALLRRARLFVSVSTGPMHIASAMGCPAATLYGPRELRYEVVRYGPYRTPARAVLSPLVCPCESVRTCADAECMAAITVEAVLAAAAALLAETAGR